MTANAAAMSDREARGAAPAYAVPIGAKPAPAEPRSGQVSVRLAANEADILAMILLGRQMHAEGRFRKYPYDEARLQAMGRAALGKGNPALLMAERDGRLIGMVVAYAGEQFFSPVKVATSQLFYVAKEARKGRAAVMLLRGLRAWAKAAGAAEINLNTTIGLELARTDRFLRKLGFRQTGGNYVLGFSES